MDDQNQSTSWTTVGYFYHPTEARIAAGRLESEGIPVYLHGVNHATANWLLTTALGGIQRQVLRAAVAGGAFAIAPAALAYGIFVKALPVAYGFAATLLGLLERRG